MLLRNVCDLYQNTRRNTPVYGPMSPSLKNTCGPRRRSTKGLHRQLHTSLLEEIGSYDVWWWMDKNDIENDWKKTAFVCLMFFVSWNPRYSVTTMCHCKILQQFNPAKSSLDKFTAVKIEPLGSWPNKKVLVLEFVTQVTSRGQINIDLRRGNVSVLLLHEFSKKMWNTVYMWFYVCIYIIYMYMRVIWVRQLNHMHLSSLS